MPELPRMDGRPVAPAFRRTIPAPTPAGPRFPTAPHPSLVGVWFLRGCGYLVLFLVFFGSWLLLLPIFAAFHVWGMTGGIAVTAALVSLPFLLLWLYCRAAVRRYSFQITAEEIRVQKGVVFRMSSRIPLAKVQDIHVRQGPLLRSRGLGSLKIETAGVSGGYAGRGSFLGSEGQIPGIRDAEAVAEAILQRVKRVRAAGPW